MTMFDLDQYAHAVKVRTLNIRLADLILVDAEAFIKDVNPVIKEFRLKYDVCERELRQICDHLRRLIVKQGEEGLRDFRDGLVSELRRPAFMINTTN